MRILMLLILLAATAVADTYVFVLNRFGGIEVKLNGNAGTVLFFQENKRGDVFTSKTELRNGLSAGGVRFDIEKLAEPVIHDTNRRINSGGYRLRIVGTGEAFGAVRARVPYLAPFASSGEDMTFYGDRTE